MTASTKQKTSWINKKPEEVEKLVVELGKQNVPLAKIGLILRDQHGIPKAKIFGKKISQILLQNNINADSEHENITKKMDKMKKHFEKHKHDYKVQRSIMKYAGRLNKLKRQQ